MQHDSTNQVYFRLLLAVLFSLFFMLLTFVASAQMVNQNTQFTKVAMFSGRPIVQDTAFLIVNGNDTVKVSIRNDSIYFWTNSSGFQFSSSIKANEGLSAIGGSTYPFLIGASSTGAGSKTFINNKSFFGITVPSYRAGYVGDLTALGLGNGTTYWNEDSIGVGSVVFGSTNSKAKGTNSQIYGGAGNVANGDYSLVAGGLLNNATSSSATIISSSASNAIDTGAIVIGSSASTASNNSAMVVSSISSTASGSNASIIGSSASTASAYLSTIISSITSTAAANAATIVSSRDAEVNNIYSGILLSTNSTIDAASSVILNSNDCHIDYDTNGNQNLIAASTECGIDGNARLAISIGSYKCYQYGTHSISLGSAYDTTYSYHEIVIGNSAFHDPTGTPNGMDYADMMMGIGNAYDSTEHQNCFIMIKNGNTVIGDSLGLGDKPAPTDAMLRIKGDVKIDSLLSLSSGLDSVTLYALTPANGTLAFCNNCTGSGVTGRVLAFINSAWRRLQFD
jgi:hypothetical protein